MRAAEVEKARLALNAATREPKPSARTNRGIKARAEHLRAWERFRSALDAAYPDNFWETLGPRYARLAAGEPDALEMAVLFLEADPWFFRSGYVKADLIKHLLRLRLPANAVSRLQSAALAVVAYRDRSEYRWYCRLARKIATPGFRFRLKLLRYSSRPDVRRRAGWMLDYVENWHTAPRCSAQHR